MKIIYFDIDGTLRDENTGVSEKTKYAIAECRKNGIKTVICTGRNPGSVQQDVLELDMDGGIYSSGCLIEFQKQSLQKVAFSEKLIQKIIEEQKQQKEQGLVIETEKQVYMNQKASEIYMELFIQKTGGLTEAEREEIKRKNHFLYENNMESFHLKCEKVYKICFTGNETALLERQEEMKEKSDIVQLIPFGKEWLLECAPKRCNKGTAVSQLNHFLGIEKEESMSFGDGKNDMELLLATGTGIAMQDGCEDLKKVAATVCGTVQKDGIYYELVKRKLIKEKRA